MKRLAIWKGLLMQKIKPLVYAIMIVLLQVCLLLTNGFAQSAPITARELVETSALNAHVEELKNGRIVMLTRPEHESANQLNVLMAILVSASLEKTVDTLQRQATAKDGPGILAIGEIKKTHTSELGKAFDGVTYTAGEKEEVENMMAIGAGKHFNYSRDEIALIKKYADSVKDNNKTGAEATNAMSLAMRDVLKGRYLAYQKRGLEGLAPYQEGTSKQIHPSRELISATESLDLVMARFPHYFECLRYYPRKKYAELVNQFFWAKQMESGRPLFMLKHWVLDVRADHALITERRFFLNHSLNSLQVVIGCLPHHDSTLVVLLNQAFTEKIDVPVGKSIAKKIGYHEVEKNIRPMFENLRTALKL